MKSDEARLKLERFLTKYKLLNRECPYSLEIKDDCTVWLKWINIEDLLNNIDSTNGKLSIKIPSIVDGIELDSFLRLYIPANVYILSNLRRQIEDNVGKIKELEIVGTGKPIITTDKGLDFQSLYEPTIFRKKDNVNDKDIRLASSKMRKLQKLSFVDFDATKIRKFNLGTDALISSWFDEVDASGLKLSRVDSFTDFRYFYDLQIGTIEWKNVDFSGLDDAMWLFRGSDITQNQFVQDGFSQTLRPKSAQFMFSDCKKVTGLVNIDLTKSDQQLQMYEDSNLCGKLTIGRGLYPQDSLQYKNAEQVCILEFGKYRNTKITQINIDSFSAVYPKEYIDLTTDICMSYGQIFSNCKLLKNARIRGIDIQIEGVYSRDDLGGKCSYINLERAFESDQSLEEVVIENIYAPLQSVDMQFIFQECSNLKRVVFRNIVIFDIGRIMGMFDDCTNIQQIEFDNVYVMNKSASNFSLKSLITDWINSKNDEEQENNLQLINKITETFSSGIKIDKTEHLKYKPIQLYERCIRQQRG